MGKNRGQLKASLVTYALCLALAAPVWSADTAPLRGYRRKRRYRARMGGQIPRHPRPGQPARLHAAPLRAPASCRLAVRQGQRRVDPRQIQGVGARRADRNLRRPLPHAEGARCSKWSSPRAFTAKLAEPAVAGDPTSSQHERAASRLQRLLDRWRRDRAAGLRELRHPGRLRDARPPGHLRQGRDRDRALRRLVARHQAQGRGRARRGRLPHLLRPARGRLLPGRRLSQGPVPQRRRRAARQRHGYAGLSRRSADARRRRHARMPSGCHRSEAHDAHQDPGAADLLRRRAAAAGRARRVRSRRPAGAALCPSPITSGPGPPRCISSSRSTGTSSRSTT